MRPHPVAGFAGIQRRHERGVALVVSLIFLLILTLIGVTAVGTSNLQQKMSVNQRDASVAFDATESALRWGERWVGVLAAEPYPPSASNPGTTGVWSFSAPGDVYANATLDSFWTSNAIEYGVAGSKDINSTDPGKLTPDPYYLIEYRKFVPDDLNLGGGPEPKAGSTYYRVTARGHGMTNRSTAVLQSHYVVRW